ncbi:hypothetical protein EK21DRAFT_81902, partial [Setomelanomma holmii]
YITVSYCWAQLDGIHSLDTPDYRIWESRNTTSSKSLRCPKGVFHRAIRFSQHSNCPFIWIDQECINQSDPEDVKKHLQVMDRVYSRSLCTVSPLATDPFLEHHHANVLDV